MIRAIIGIISRFVPRVQAAPETDFNSPERVERREHLKQALEPAERLLKHAQAVRTHAGSIRTAQVFSSYNHKQPLS